MKKRDLDAAPTLSDTLVPTGEASGFGAALTRLGRLFGVDAERQSAISLPPKPSPKPFDTSSLEKDASQASFVRAFDALHTPVVIVGERLVVMHANEEARHLFGEKIMGRNFSMFLRDPKAVDSIDDALRDGQFRQVDVSMDVPLKRRYKLNMTRLAQVAGQSRQVVMEFQEVTLIQRSESMRSEFVANVSHELRSPLATLIGFIETLKDDGDDPEMRDRFLTIMDGEAQRMRRLIDDLLSLTNVELREHERPRTLVDLNGVLHEVVNSLTPRARASDVNIELSVPGELPRTQGDRDQLIQVFHNLLTNAIKYGVDGKRVNISVAILANGLPEGGPSVEVRVRDFGQGIDAEHLPRLTERFYRVDKGRSRAVGGTGLGLAIVKHIVNRHRGRLFVESERGKGSLFKVRLPLSPSVENAAAATKS